MKPVRLLPIVVMAGSALLGLKLIGIASGTGYVLSGVTSVVAQDAVEDGEGALDAAGAAAEAADQNAADAASSLLFGPDASTGGMPVVEGLAPGQSTESVLLERLAERRAELDALEAEIGQRLTLVEAAEVRINERMAELAALEAQVAALVDGQGEAHRAQFAGVVAMYAGMRARDAAAIFDDLAMEVLVEVTRAMDPRTLGPIVAEMNPVRAQELTVRLTAPQPPEFAASAAVPEGDEALPQIVGE